MQKRRLREAKWVEEDHTTRSCSHRDWNPCILPPGVQRSFHWLTHLEMELGIFLTFPSVIIFGSIIHELVWSLLEAISVFSVMLPSKSLKPRGQRKKGIWGFYFCTLSDPWPLSFWESQRPCNLRERSRSKALCFGGASWQAVRNSQELSYCSSCSERLAADKYIKGTLVWLCPWPPVWFLHYNHQWA